MLSRYTLHPFDPCFDAKQHNRYTVDKARWEEQVRENQQHFISTRDLSTKVRIVRAEEQEVMVAWREHKAALAEERRGRRSPLLPASQF